MNVSPEPRRDDRSESLGRLLVRLLALPLVAIGAAICAILTRGPIQTASIVVGLVAVSVEIGWLAAARRKRVRSSSDGHR